MVKCSHIWNGFQNWCIGLPMNPGVLESWLEMTEKKSPLSRKFPKVLQPVQERGYMGFSIERTLYCLSLSILPGDAGSTQVISLGIHTHDILENLRWSNPGWGDATMNLCLHVSTGDWLLSTAHFSTVFTGFCPLHWVNRYFLTYYNKIIKTKHLLLSLTCNWIKIHIQVI